MNNSHKSHFAALIEDSAAGAAPAATGIGRRERRAAETRLRLFRCALKLFAERGFPNVTVEEITEAADVGKGTFFNYFESKDHVLGVIAEIQLGKVTEALAQAASGKETIQSLLHRIFLRLAEEPGRSPNLARTLISFFMANEKVRDTLERQLSAGRKLIAQIVATGQERGEIDSRLKKEKVALQLQEVLLGTVVLWSLKGEPGFKTWVEDSFQHFWRSVVVSGAK